MDMSPTVTNKWSLLAYEKLQPQLSSYAVMKSPVKVEKCLIKRSRNKDFEIFVNNSSKILPSNRKIEFLESFEPSKTNSTPADVPIDKICSVDDGKFISLKELSPPLSQQDLYLPVLFKN